LHTECHLGPLVDENKLAVLGREDFEFGTCRYSWHIGPPPGALTVYESTLSCSVGTSPVRATDFRKLLGGL
jgi:hypothetical protein